MRLPLGAVNLFGMHIFHQSPSLLVLTWVPMIDCNDGGLKKMCLMSGDWVGFQVYCHIGTGAKYLGPKVGGLVGNLGSYLWLFHRPESG